MSSLCRAGLLLVVLNSWDVWMTSTTATSCAQKQRRHIRLVLFSHCVMLNMSSVNRRGDYSKKNLFQYSFKQLTVVLWHTWKTVNVSFKVKAASRYYLFCKNLTWHLNYWRHRGKLSPTYVLCVCCYLQLCVFIRDVNVNLNMFFWLQIVILFEKSPSKLLDWN